MTINKTSQAVSELLQLPPPMTDEAAKGFNAILRKYKRMEEALQKAQGFFKSSFGKENKEIYEALVFDPLSALPNSQ